MNLRIQHLVCTIILCLSTASQGRAQSFANFESPQAHPIALSRCGNHLFAINTPACLLSVYSLKKADEPRLVKEIPVGLEPVSVSVFSKDEVWVVNHVSDTISVVSIPRGVVIDTIHVGDRPSDVVFAGSPARAFVTSMTQRNVWVMDVKTHRVVKKIPVFGDQPRSMLTSQDGKSVWVVSSRSGNRTTIVPHTLAPKPPPPSNRKLPPAPRQGIIVRSDDPKWRRLNVTLPDEDVFEIDVARLQIQRSYRSVGTILFNLAQRPGTNELWVANTEARNLVRFEPALRGHAVDNRITRITTGASPQIKTIDLNPDINYSKVPNPAALSTALSQPTDVVFAPDGTVAYVSSFGTDRVGVLDHKGRVIARINVTPGRAQASSRTKRGPRGLTHHPKQKILYVLNRLSNSISVIETTKQTVIREIRMFDPTPKQIREGRGFLFDAKLSGNGTMSCASCHVDGDRDGLAWDLGDPGGELFNNGTEKSIHPMKGPLLTQTLRGLRGERLFHWRADRPGLASFNVAFDTLLGGKRLPLTDMETLVAYLKTVRFSANPHRLLDDTLPKDATEGKKIFQTRMNVGREGNNQFRCADCHFRPSGAGSHGFTGLINQPMKATQLRGLFERDGRKPTEKGRLSGFGFGADGSKDDLITFLAKSHRFGELSRGDRAALQRFLFAFPTETAPIVGFTQTVTTANVKSGALQKDLHLLMKQAELGKCDLIAKGVLNKRRVGFLFDGEEKKFLSDRARQAPKTFAQLVALLRHDSTVLTFTGVAPGDGRRLGIDRDCDGTLDGDP